MVTSSVIASKEMLLDALGLYREVCSDGKAFNAPETVIGFFLELDVDMADAHMLLAAIQVIDEYGLTVS